MSSSIAGNCEPGLSDLEAASIGLFAARTCRALPLSGAAAAGAKADAVCSATLVSACCKLLKSASSEDVSKNPRAMPNSSFKLSSCIEGAPPSGSGSAEMRVAECTASGRSSESQELMRAQLATLLIWCCSHMALAGSEAATMGGSGNGSSQCEGAETPFAEFRESGAARKERELSIDGTAAFAQGNSPAWAGLVELTSSILPSIRAVRADTSSSAECSLRSGSSHKWHSAWIRGTF